MKKKCMYRILCFAVVQSLLFSMASFAGTWWFSPDGEWYYHDESSMPVYGWVKDNGYWYYLSHRGLITSAFTPDGYWVNADGVWYEEDVNKPSRVEMTNLNVVDRFKNTNGLVTLITPHFQEPEDPESYRITFSVEYSFPSGYFQSGDLSRVVAYGQSGLELYYMDEGNTVECYVVTMPSRERWADITVRDLQNPHDAFYSGSYTFGRY